MTNLRAQCALVTEVEAFEPYYSFIPEKFTSCETKIGMAGGEKKTRAAALRGRQLVLSFSCSKVIAGLTRRPALGSRAHGGAGDVA